MITAQGITEAYKAMSYDAVAISSNDLSAGPVFFQLSRDNSFPWIAANLYDNNDSLIFSPHIIKKVDSLSIGIIGLTGADGKDFKDFIIGDWRKALQKEISLLENSCDILVVLSNLNRLENEEIQHDFKKIDIIVTADQKGTNIQPQVLQHNLLIQSGHRGKYIGKLDITWLGHGDWLPSSLQQIADPKNRINSIDRQLSLLEKQQIETKRNFSEKINQLRSYRQKIIDQMPTEEAQLSENEVKYPKRFTSLFIPVKPNSSNNNITSIVQEIKNSIITFNRYRRSELQLNDPAKPLALQNDEIVGTTSCSACHEKQTEFWKKTRHFKAYTTLSGIGQSLNLQCLPCHVTAGKINTSSIESEKLFLLSLNNDRQTVGCEVCHGPGKQHLSSPEEMAPLRLPPAEVCMQCHTPDQDNNFDYQKKLAAIACPAG